MNPEAIRRFSARAAAVAEALHPGVVTIGGTDHPCALGDPPVTDSMAAGGLDLGAALLAVVRKETMPEPPARGAIATARGIRWVVASVTGHGYADAAWTLRLEPHN